MGTEGRSHELREVRLKVFLSREGTPSLPSIYGLFRGADWQERETFDMFGIQFDGHPHPKRLLMPEDWKGWPLRKDYVQPDFYEMQGTKKGEVWGSSAEVKHVGRKKEGREK